MCCSRGHYPETVGLHTETHNYSEGRHYHIILPWSHSIAICISGYKNNINIVWREFLFSTQRMESVNISAKYSLNLQKLTDVIAMGIAEGGTLHKEWLEEVIAKWRKDNQTDDDIFVLLAAQLREEWKIIPPPALEYHEWLMTQAQQEVTTRQTFKLADVVGKVNHVGLKGLK